MKLNHWTLALAAAGVVSMGAVAQAEEATESVKTLVSGTTISGYVSTSALWNPGTGTTYPAAISAFHGGSNTAGKNDGFNLDHINLTISKAMDEGEWAAGYKAELWFGDDAFGLATGNRGGAEDMAIKQAYVGLRAPVGNGIDFKMGVFDTAIGYEATNVADNPNYTRSLAWSLQPTTHTGLSASYRFNDMFAVSGGVVNGRGPVINAKVHNVGGAAGATLGSESSKGYFGAFELTAPDDWGFLSGSKLQVQAMDSPNVRTQDTIDLHVAAILNTPVEAWKVGISYYYRANAGTATTIGAVRDSDYASVWGLYNSYQATEKLALHLRAEYLTATEGTIASAAAPAGAGDNDPSDALFGLTATVDYSLWENVISRLELRWDTSLTGGGASSSPFGGVAAAGGPGEDQKSNFLVALNVIYKF
jgi:hypothetical protein